MQCRIVTLLVLVFCLCMTACSKPEAKLIGRWAGKTGAFEFAQDRTGIITPPQGGNVPFKWSMQGSDVVRMDIGASVNRTYFGKLEGDQILVVEDGTFEKQK